jgi:dolichol-phosphate mannosyltransferase
LLGAPEPQPFLSIVIPAHNEEDCIAKTVRAITDEFRKQGVSDYEVLVVNDNSRDGTEEILKQLAAEIATVRYVNNSPPNGFGFAVRKGLDEFRGEAVAIVMGDLSDDPADMVEYYRQLKAGAECVFGSRFIRGSRVHDYPALKLRVNRLANWFIKVLFRIPFNDVTNAFKAYRRDVIDGIRPFLSNHFNLTVELPLKAIVRGYSYVVVPISWTNREAGVSKLKLKEQGSRYLFIVLYAWLEKRLTRGDYTRKSW